MLQAEVEETGREPEKLRGFLKRTVEKKVANHKKRWRPPRAGGVDADETLATSRESDPEGTAELYEELMKVERWSRGLPPELVEVLRCVYGGRMSVEETAEALGRSRSTVYDQLRAASRGAQGDGEGVGEGGGGERVERKRGEG